MVTWWLRWVAHHSPTIRRLNKQSRHLLLPLADYCPSLILPMMASSMVPMIGV